MIKHPDKNTVFFDVDDTLVLWNPPSSEEEKCITITTEAGYKVWCLPHFKHIEAIKEHKARGHFVVVWSQGGADWAEKVVDALELRNLVDVVICKPSWFYDDLPANVFMPESIRYWRDPNKTTKVIQPQNDYSNNPPD